ncbi:MAG TPA: hypothetical protein VF950_27570 [Planctomycetota bacterium]
MGLISPLVAFFAEGGDDERRGRSGETLRVSLPQCELCGAAGAPKPIRVDRERSVLTFVVHVGFKRRVTSA